MGVNSAGYTGNKLAICLLANGFTAAIFSEYFTGFHCLLIRQYVRRNLLGDFFADDRAMNNSVDCNCFPHEKGLLFWSV